MKEKDTREISRARFTEVKYEPIYTRNRLPNISTEEIVEGVWFNGIKNSKIKDIEITTPPIRNWNDIAFIDRWETQNVTA